MAPRIIVLVEDDDRLRTILARALTRNGHRVHPAASGAAARELLRRLPVDLLLLDVNLPDETGWELLRWLRAQLGRQPRVAMLTAGRPPRSRVEALRPEAILTKPFPIEVLMRLAATG